jgi:hypothetical protein
MVHCDNWPMSWKISRLATSLLGLVREPDTSVATAEQEEHIRQEMLDCMAVFLPPAAQRPALWTKLAYASDIQALWFLRSDVMHWLSGHCGETLAAARVANLTEMFRGHIPGAQFASARKRR